ncbi:MAG: heparinase II/III family protein [Clostridia bacterium]|nr:heparinase II/III family protein [Clostridia bacterium]
MIFDRLKDVAFWNGVRKDARYAPLIAEAEARWVALRYEGEIPVLSFADRMLFYKTGDRKIFETPYFRRRNSLSVAAVLALIDPENDIYIDYVQRMLWAICDEYSWAVPAHTKGDPATDVDEIDLFNAETAFAVTEICEVLGARIDCAVRERVKIEVERRIFATYRTRVSWYETLDSNWAAVCGGNVGGAMMYLEPALFEHYLPRFLDTMRRFISGFSEEGICMEGTSYWNYGFANFTWFADMLLDFTHGRVDLFDDDKTARVAAYMHKSFLKGNTTVSFSDGTRKGKTFDALQYYLSLRYPDTVSLLPRDCSYVLGGNVIWMNLSRAFVYAPPLDAVRVMRTENYDLPMAQQVIVNEGRYSLFAKAGHNAEQYNHNDGGSFILSTDAGQVLCDIGSGLYTKQYFRFAMDKRYAILCNSSLGHSVPIVNGMPQLCGEQYAGSIVHTENRIEIEMAGAYGQADFTSLSRVLEHHDGGVTLTDSFSACRSFTERFVTMLEPTVEEGSVRIADVRLVFDPYAMTPTVSTEKHVTHESGEETVYCIDFAVNPAHGRARFDFVIG